MEFVGVWPLVVGLVILAGAFVGAVVVVVLALRRARRAIVIWPNAGDDGKQTGAGSKWKDG